MALLNVKAEASVGPPVEEAQTEIIAPLDDRRFDALVDMLEQRWGRLEICAQSIAFYPKDDLHGRLLP